MNTYGMSEEAWGNLVREEQNASIGFTGSGSIEQERIAALKALRGDADVSHLEGRSKVNDTSIAEAVESIMPDLMEIFTGGEDVAAFDPVGPEDEGKAEQETMATVHMFMERNRGFENIFDYCQDALRLKTGIFKVQWEKDEDTSKREIQGVEAAVADEIAAMGFDVEYDEERGVAVLTETKDSSYVKVTVVPPEDFGVAADTVEICDTSYCVERMRGRMQDWEDEGFDRAKLLRCTNDLTHNEGVEQARDTVENSEEFRSGNGGGLRQVIVHAHYVRYNPDGEGLRYFQVMTSADCEIVLSVEEVDVIPFAAGTPYRNAHRFFGDSLYDKLIETQKIKTSLTRLMLDTGYFAVGGRYEVDVNRLTKWTMTDLAKNAPGSGVRTQGSALKPLQAGQLPYDVMGALEYASVMGEQKSGVVRNAQGLNPDTLHDTAKGMNILYNAAQKRTRLIARVLAQGIKDSYLLTHRIMRTNGRTYTLKIAEGQYEQIEPSEWEFRKDATLKIGVGSGGRQEKLFGLQQVLNFQKQAVEMQGGANGPLVAMENIHNAFEDFVKASGLSGGRYFSDPQRMPPQPEKPDPKLIEAQAKQSLEAQKAQGKMALEREKLEHDKEVDFARIQTEREIALIKAGLQAQQGQVTQNIPGGDLSD